MLYYFRLSVLEAAILTLRNDLKHFSRHDVFLEYLDTFIGCPTDHFHYFTASMYNFYMLFKNADRWNFRLSSNKMSTRLARQYSFRASKFRNRTKF